MPDLPALVSGLSTAPALLPAVVLMSGLGPTEVPSVVGIVLVLQPAIVLMWWSWRAAPARGGPGAPAGRESEAPPEPADTAPTSETPNPADAASPSETPEPADAASPSGTPKPTVRERALEAAEAADAAPTSETPEPADAAPESEVPAAEAAPTPLRRAGGQLIGAREAQEDEFGFIDGSTLDPDGRHPVVIVADGMGGHAGGEMAGRLAVRAFVDAYGLDGAPADRLGAALDAANRSIDDAVRENLSLDGMGATLVAATVTTDGLEWISVGDSPLYLYRAGRLKRLNEDHSMA
ncbi:MAG: SpoIIE family protein phosphatase, partial [Acidobacteria bacterium]|nr:SpoIIE family protein phosphatase [Acidobacteriota bacterium]